MKKKLIIIFTVITLSMIGIIYFQADSVFKTYEFELKKINSDADNAMREALSRYQKEHSDSISKLLHHRLALLNDTVGIGFSNNSDSLTIYLEDTYKPGPYQKGTSRSVREGFHIGRIKVTFPTMVFIQGKLQSKNRYEKIKKTIREILPAEVGSCDPLYFKPDSAKISRYFKESLIKMDMGELNKSIQLIFICSGSAGFKPHPFPAYYIGTSFYEYPPNGFEAYTGNKRWVAAYFHGHRFNSRFFHNGFLYNHSSNWVLSRMKGPVVLSAALILVIVFSFIYLLLIILKQKRLSDMKDDFINNMTHELKTPIATISAAIESMQKFNTLQDKEKTERYLETSRKELNRLNNLVTKVLDMAGYEKKNIELRIKGFDINEMINEIITLEKLNSAKDLHFTFTNTDAVKHIKADPLHFRNAVANLIDNAVKYSADPVEIIINCYKDEKFIYLSVKDNGMGIPALQISRIFDKFHRVPTGNIHNIKGTGLGLSYVKYVIEAHGGTVTVKSEPGKGSVFIISLPII